MWCQNKKTVGKLGRMILRGDIFLTSQEEKFGQFSAVKIGLTMSE